MASSHWQAPGLAREQRVAARVLRHTGLLPPVEVQEVAAHFADLEEDDIPGECDGLIIGLHIGRRQRPLIIVERSASVTRKRFTVAHELGHFLLPWHEGTATACDVKVSETWSEEAWFAWRAETQANRFASALLIPPEWIDEIVSLAGPHDLPAVFDAVTAAGVSAHVMCIAISQRLPPGRLFVILDSDGSTLLSGTSPNSSAQLPYVGEQVDFDRLNRFADDRVTLRFGSREIHWWTYSPTTVGPVDDPRSTREILESLLAKYSDDENHRSELRRSFGGIAGSAKSMSMQRGGTASTEQVYVRLRRAFAKPRGEVPDEMLEDDDFELWLRKRALEISEK